MKRILLLLFCISWFGTGLFAQLYFPVSFNQPPQLMANAGADQIICNGATATLGNSPAATGGTPAYTYSWTSGGPLNQSNIANPTAAPIQSETYVLTVTDDRGCRAVDSVLITVDTCTHSSSGIAPFQVTVFPNPSNGRFSVRLDGETGGSEIELRLMNPAGQIIEHRDLILKEGIQDILFDRELARGNYLLTLTGKNQKWSYSVIIH